MFYRVRMTAAIAVALLASACSKDTVRLPPQPPSSSLAPGKTTYTQIERLSRPAVKEVFERFVDHQVSNAAEPYNDPTLQAAIPAVTVALGRSQATANFLQAVLYPDAYTVDLSQSGSAAYLGVESGGATGGKFGGRDINDNVIDISLGALFGGTAHALAPTTVPDDGAENNCLTTEHVTQKLSQAKMSGFPYLNAPH